MPKRVRAHGTRASWTSQSPIQRAISPFPACPMSGHSHGSRPSSCPARRRHRGVVTHDGHHSYYKPTLLRLNKSHHESPKQLWHAPARAVKAGHRAMISARPWSRFAVVAIGPLRRSRAHLAVRSNRLAPTPQESLRFLRARGREPEQSVMAHLSRRCRRPLYVTSRYTALYCRNRSRSLHFTLLGCPRIFTFVYLPTRSRCTIPMRLTAIAMGKPLRQLPHCAFGIATRFR
jgi:hypothetical protein